MHGNRGQVLEDGSHLSRKFSEPLVDRTSDSKNKVALNDFYLKWILFITGKICYHLRIPNREQNQISAGHVKHCNYLPFAFVPEFNCFWSGKEFCFAILLFEKFSGFI